MRLPNSTPMVKSCTRWNRLSVNCNNRQDLPTPAKEERKQKKAYVVIVVVIIIIIIFASFE